MLFHKKMIVAVDDSGIFLKKLTKVLGENYDLHAFSVGKRALQFLKERTPDLIILDIDMPEINGYEMLKMIKEREHLQNVPVIFLTSNGDRDSVIKVGSKRLPVKSHPARGGFFTLEAIWERG